MLLLLELLLAQMLLVLAWMLLLRTPMEHHSIPQQLSPVVERARCRLLGMLAASGQKLLVLLLAQTMLLLQTHILLLAQMLLLLAQILLLAQKLLVLS